MVTPRPTFPLFLLGSLLLSPLPSLGKPSTTDLTYERDESLPEYDSNCVGEAFESFESGEDSWTCPWVPTPLGFPYPSRAIRVLDDLYFVPGLDDPGAVLSRAFRSPSCLPSCPSDPPNASNSQNTISYPPFNPTRVGGAMNPHRTTGGSLLPDVILPGIGYFEAWLGYWNDLNGNGILDSYWTRSGLTWVPAPSNEWVSILDSTLVTYLEPGSHPTLSDPRRPSSFDPDVLYRYGCSNCQNPYPPYDAPYVSRGGPWESSTISYNFVLFSDGSLLREVVATTITDPQAGPGPYLIPSPLSLVDVDHYVALSPEPLGSAYSAVAGPLVDSYGSPSAGLCPFHCRTWPEPSRVGGSLGVGFVDDAIDSLVGIPFGRYPRPYDPSLNGSASGRYDEYRERYTLWMHIVPVLGWEKYSGRYTANTALVLATFWTPLGPINPIFPLVRGEKGGLAIPPATSLGAYVFVGAWKDINGDGFVGVASTPDPYENGTRPLPDNYLDSRGEFLPGEVVAGKDGFSVIPIRAYPETSFEDLGEVDTIVLRGSLCPLLYTTLCPDPPRVASGGGGTYFFNPYGNGYDFLWGTLRSGLVLCAGPSEVVVRGVPEVGELRGILHDCAPIERLPQGPFLP